jgi:Asp-tRNA(Asn)/Glu-tRNA(Gln) amidotransferase A subunit family amidase
VTDAGKPEPDALEEWLVEIEALDLEGWEPLQPRCPTRGPGEARSRDGHALVHGTATAVSETERALERIDSFQPVLNAFLCVMREPALRDAEAVDAARRSGAEPGALAGIPFAVKDVFATDDAPTTGASKALVGYRVGPDAAIISRLRDAGGILVGKTNLHELGWGFAEEVGRVNNPLDPRLEAGGSSGGSAAAVGSGCVRVAIGTDAGGSIRIPAAFCGVVGLKPTFGRVPLQGSLPGSWSLGAAGPLASSVADARAVFDLIADPPSRPASPSAFTADRLAVIAGSVGSAEPRLADALDDCLDRLRAGGWEVDVVELPELASSEAAWSVTYAAELSASLRPWLGDRLRNVSPDLRSMVEFGDRVPAASYLHAQRFRSRLFHAVERSLMDVRALLTPAVRFAPTEQQPEDGDEAWLGNNLWLAPLNLTGHPAVALPLRPLAPGKSVQLIGAYGNDENLLDTAAEIESMLGA